jgi:hypothetical protein
LNWIRIRMMISIISSYCSLIVFIMFMVVGIGQSKQNNYHPCDYKYVDEEKWVISKEKTMIMITSYLSWCENYWKINVLGPGLIDIGCLFLR